jgi:exosome complex component RRP40
MNSADGDVVIPGDVIQLPAKPSGKLVLGPGLSRVREEVHVTKCGVLRQGGNNIFYVDSRQKKYIPARGECVVGVVTNARGEMFRVFFNNDVHNLTIIFFYLQVDIGSSDEASISYLAFENATKKNRPIINVGDVIFAKLLVASKDMEPELVCVDSHGKKGRLGILPEGGFLFSCSMNLVRKILKPSCPLLKSLGRDLAYEVVVGMNGMVWVKTNSVRETILVCDAMLKIENLPEKEIENVVKELMYNLSSA